MALLLACAGVVSAAETVAGCPDLSGEYQNRASEASAGEVYLSDLLGIRPGVTRVIFQRLPDGMILRAPQYDMGMYELFVPWSDFWCEGNERILGFDKDNEALNQHEGRPIGGSSSRRLAFSKAPDGALMVNYSASGNWYAPLAWGIAPGTFSGQLRARFDSYKR
ncbi:MAG TPA: hypothetical protein VF859_05485 [Burkholderiales bacterium]